MKMEMSREWLAEHKLKETKSGWEGPRWRFLKERQELGLISNDKEQQK